ncbi:MAG TPA: CHAT domain-containing protein, partial [Armatimonadota bacterium]|nr:CHAT domain-containing protein [Armatimonadota bacterium]
MRERFREATEQERTRNDQLARRRETRGPQLEPVVAEMERAAIEGRDADAVALMMTVVDRLHDEPDNTRYCEAAHTVAGLLWLLGAEAVIPPLRHLVDARGDPSEGHPRIISYIAWTCWNAWFGRNDIFRDTVYWTTTHLDLQRHEVPWAYGDFASKLGVFGRQSEAIGMANYYIGAMLAVPPDRRRCSSSAGGMVWPGAPADLRRSLVWLMLEQGERVQSQAFRSLRPALSAMRANLGGSSRAWIADPAWAIETGFDLVTLAERMGKPEDCIAVLEEAAKFFEVTSRPDLVAQTVALAQAVAAANPEALRQLALSRAQWAAAEGRWSDVIALLTSGFANEPSTVELLQACVLMTHAYLGLGQVADADRLFQKASELVGSAGLSAGERANYYVGLSRMTQDRELQSKLLQQARTSLEGAGLDLIANSVDQELAALALETDDLPAAQEALTDVIDRIERQRQRLAFDPLLRQRWFADNITPYRQLTRVTALQDDAELALGCGERMRGRALLDQLAWKQVDLQVALPPQLSQRIAQLRTARQQAYELLARVMGGSAGTDTRGAYMPIRGLYMPVRGGLDEGAPVTDADVARLRAMLDGLAAEEAALEGAVREQVPAYARAASLTIPSGAQIAAEVAKHPGLAVLEYTFADQGLAVVALAGGKTRVELIDCDRDTLYEQIGRFREAIWERSDDTRAQARELYRTLVEPVEGMLSGAARLWIVADGAVQLVPFAALLDDHDRYLGQRVPIAFAPSLTLALSSRGQRPAPARSAVIVAAPETGATQLASTAGDDGRGLYMPIRGMYMPARGMYMPIRGEGVSSALTAMAMVPLPEAKAEGEAIAGRFPDALLLTGAEATKSALGQVGGDCGVLHIATHGYADPDFPDFSGLLLAAPEGAETPYQVLTAGEVYGWPLNARLVTLSACQTALGRDVEGEGILGLSRAFIYAGAQDVVCSLWPVSDESTKTLMTAFYAALAA